ncbi:MAG: flagellar biosynthesis protein FlhF [Desulfovibrionaceae bacterium]
MRVRTFRSKSMAAALHQVKAELGDDAVILGNKTVNENGSQLVEIMAAVDGGPGGSQAAAAIQAAAQAGACPAENLDALITRSAQAGGDGFAAEWPQIKEHLLALLKPQMSLDHLAPRQRLAMEHLEREGVDTGSQLWLFRQLKANPDISILKALDGLLGVKPFTRKSWPQKMHFFAGPHGVGKTSTLIRLALREKQLKPKSRICLASADHGQGKGRLVLRHYADLSGLAFREVATLQDMAALVAESKQFDKIFIDLPGLAGKTTLSERLQELGISPGLDIAGHLVLAPQFGPAQLKAFLKRYDSDCVQSVIWTKLDEACNYGAMVNTAYAGGLPVSALSYGPGLRNSIAPAQVEHVWRVVFKHELPQEIQE